MKQQRTQLNSNQIKLNDLENSFKEQKQLVQLVIDAVEHHHLQEENDQAPDSNDEKDDIEPDKSDLQTNESGTYESSLLWFKKNLAIDHVETVNLSQVPMILTVSEQGDDQNVQGTGKFLLIH